MVLLQPFGTVDETAPTDKASRTELVTSSQVAVTGGRPTSKPGGAKSKERLQPSSRSPATAAFESRRGCLGPGHCVRSKRAEPGTATLFLRCRDHGVVQRNCSHLLPFTPSRPSKPVRVLSATSGQSNPIVVLQASPLTLGSSDVPGAPSTSVIPGITRSPFFVASLAARLGRRVRPPERRLASSRLSPLQLERGM